MKNIVFYLFDSAFAGYYFYGFIIAEEATCACPLVDLINVESKAKSALLRGSETHKTQELFPLMALFKKGAFAFQWESKQTRKNSVQN